MEALLGYAPLLLALAAVMSLIGLARWMVEEERAPFEIRPSLLSEQLHKLHSSLHEAVAGRWLIFPQIHLANVIQVKEKADEKAYWQEKVGGHRFDFVLVDPQSLAPRLAIDLDTSGKNPPPPLDPGLDRCLQASGLPHWRVAAGDDYDVREMHKALLRAIG